jgi:hypothetical protein
MRPELLLGLSGLQDGLNANLGIVMVGISDLTNEHFSSEYRILLSVFAAGNSRSLGMLLPGPASPGLA